MKKKYIPVIERNIPLPEREQMKDTYTSVIKAMKVGDSIWLPTSAGAGRYLARKALGPNTYICRNEIKDNEGGCRLWRVDK